MPYLWLDFMWWINQKVKDGRTVILLSTTKKNQLPSFALKNNVKSQISNLFASHNPKLLNMQFLWINFLTGRQIVIERFRWFLFSSNIQSCSSCSSHIFCSLSHFYLLTYVLNKRKIKFYVNYGSPTEISPLGLFLFFSPFLIVDRNP